LANQPIGVPPPMRWSDGDDGEDIPEQQLLPVEEDRDLDGDGSSR